MKKTKPKITKAELVGMYAFLILTVGHQSVGHQGSSKIFSPLNRLIIAKWSVYALEDIKKRAWKLADTVTDPYQLITK